MLDCRIREKAWEDDGLFDALPPAPIIIPLDADDTDDEETLSECSDIELEPSENDIDSDEEEVSCGDPTWKLGEAMDFTGAAFADENDIGAYMVPPKKSRRDFCMPNKLFFR